MTRVQGPDDGLRPWRVVVALIVKNMTKDYIAERTIERVFSRWPDPESLAASGPDLEEVLADSGLQRRKAEAARNFSRSFFFWEEDSLDEYPIPPPLLVQSWPFYGAKTGAIPRFYTEWYEAAR